MKHLFAGCTAALALAALAGAANATPVTAGGTVTPSTSTLAGATFVTSTSGTISPGTFTANYTSSVYREAGGTYDFVYSFSNSTGSANSIESFTAYNFAGFTTDVSYVTGTGSAPTDAKSNGAGSVITYDFTGVAPGATSDTLIIRTNGVGYTSGTMSLQDGSAGSGTGFSPTSVSAAPEPGTWALMLGGVGLLGLMLRGRLGRRRDEDVTGFTAA